MVNVIANNHFIKFRVWLWIKLYPVIFIAKHCAPIFEWYESSPCLDKAIDTKGHNSSTCINILSTFNVLNESSHV